MSDSNWTVADHLAASQTDERGTCPFCKREGVPVSDENTVCFPCYGKKAMANMAANAVDRAAGKVINKIHGRDEEPS